MSSSSSEQEKTNDASLKKGTWSKEEDKILVEYVKKYGVGNWNAIQKRTELTRCGKSCRLRWNNHLKAGVKKGKFSEQEEQKVIRMKELGFKWYQIAQQLPGRSDNDIKNFWNARKRKQNRNPKLSGSSSLSNDHRKYPSNHDEMIKNNYSEQLPNLIDVPNKQLPTFPNLLVDDSNKQLPKIPRLVDDSIMIYNNVGSTSISNHTTPTWTNRASIGTSFMHARVPNLPTLPSYLAFQNMDYPLGKYPSRYDEIDKKQLPNLFNVPNKELPKWVDDSNMFYNNVGSASTSNFKGGYGTSSKQFTMVPNPLPPCPYIQNMDYQLPSYNKLVEYPQNPLPPPKEARYQRTGPVSLVNLSNFFTHFKKVMEDSQASRVRSSKVNLVDEKGKKPISFENDFGANFFSNYTDSSRQLVGSLLDNDDNNNLNDKLPHDVKDTLDGAINERGIGWDILPNFGSLDNNNNNNLNDKLPRDVKDRLDAATNERGVDWDILHNFGSLENINNNTLHLKLPDDVKDALVATINGKGIVPYHLPNVILSDNNDNNNLHDKIPHNIKDTLGAVIYGKSFHPK